MTQVQADGTTAYFYKNANSLVLDGLQSITTLDFIDDSSGLTIVGKLFAAGADPDSASPIGTATLVYQVNSNGRWVGTFASDVAVALGDTIPITVEITGNVLRNSRWVFTCTVINRTVP